MEKAVPFEQARELAEALRRAGKRVVLCHGTFDLVHPGHVLFLEEARALGDVLIVSVRAGDKVHKGPGRPLFTDALRVRSLAGLACVDHVVVVPFSDGADAVRHLRPHVYCRAQGEEAGPRSPGGSPAPEAQAAAEVGAEMRYVGTLALSSDQLFNRHFEPVSRSVREFCRHLAGTVNPGRWQAMVEQFAGLRVLVVGDTILDRYSYVAVQGLTSKNRIISGRFLREETQCGGALAVFRHVAQFARRVRFVSLVGQEPWIGPLLREHVGADQDFVVRDARFTTVIKQRFAEPLAEGKELAKLFAVNYLDAGPPSPETIDSVRGVLRDQLAECDVVLVADFGHGLFQPVLRELVQESAPFLALNCQTNSNNHGFNIISRQYRRADAFSLDEQELRLACGRRDVDYADELRVLQDQLGARYAWLTRGAIETIGLKPGEPASFCPPLENDITDTVGAGDAFFSVASLAAACGLPVSVGTFMGQLAGAQAVKIVGNARPISRGVLMETGMSMLNF